MQLEHPNVERIRANTVAYAEGRIEEVVESYASGLVWYFSGDHPWGGETRGRDLFFRMVAEVDEQVPADLELMQAAAIGDEIVVCHYRMNGRIGDQQVVDEDCAIVFRFGADGTIVSGAEFYPAVVNAALGRLVRNDWSRNVGAEHRPT